MVISFQWFCLGVIDHSCTKEIGDADITVSVLRKVRYCVSDVTSATPIHVQKGGDNSQLLIFLENIRRHPVHTTILQVRFRAISYLAETQPDSSPRRFDRKRVKFKVVHPIVTVPVLGSISRDDSRSVGREINISFWGAEFET